MRRTIFALGVAAVILVAAEHDSLAQRGGRGGGGGGAGRGGGGPGPYGGGAVRQAPTVVGPAGGTRSAGSGSGSHTTKGGTTIDYGGAARGGTTPGGVDYGRGVGGVQVTTPGGRDVTKVGTAGGAAGPRGNAVGGKSGAVVGSGPGGGSFGKAYHGGVAVGPQGGAVAGGRAGAATGPGGNTVGGGARGGVAAGPYGAVAGQTTTARGAGGTYYRSAAAISGQGNTVRQNFRGFARVNPVLTARWLGPTYRPITWAALAGWAGYTTYAAQPIYYSYGENVIYSGTSVVYPGVAEIPVEQYVQQATDIATVGVVANPDPKQGEWQQLGVFAMVGEGEEKSTNLFQLAINKAGVIGGEYYNALTDQTEPTYGSVDNKTQRAAWTVGNRKFPVYEAGIANLTLNETTILVHFSKEKTQQFTLVRIQQPNGE